MCLFFKLYFYRLTNQAIIKEGPIMPFCGFAARNHQTKEKARLITPTVALSCCGQHLYWSVGNFAFVPFEA